MSTVPLSPGYSPLLPAGIADKKAAALAHVAGSARLAAVRPASRLEVRPLPEMLSTGVAELDAVAGGVPRGCLTEIYGEASSGKTSVLLATIAAATGRDESCVLIDASDSFDPTSGAAAGIDFNRLLWVRCNDRKLPLKNNNVEARSSPALKLEQVLKATDLILQSGGFGLVVLDLAGIPEKFVRRIPLTSWFRFQRAVEHTKTALLVISEFACAQTCATVGIKFGKQPPGNQSSAVSYQPSGKATHGSADPSHALVFESMPVQAELVRSRLERKPMKSVTTVFKSQSASLAAGFPDR